MTNIADAVRAALVPFLAVTGLVLILLVCHVVLLHGARKIAFHRRQRLLAVYRNTVAAAMQHDNPAESLRGLLASPRRHRPAIATLILEPLRVAEGSVTERARATATALGLITRWQSDLSHRRWWIRANGAHALGLLKCQSAVGSLIIALDDPYEEVRAAAVEALGLIADPEAIPELIARLPQQSRHQRVRLVQALRLFGRTAVPPLLDHARAQKADLASVADLLASIEAVDALGQLVEWCRHDRAEVRTAAVRAIGAIGVDDRAYYHILRALNDDAAEVRAAAAWTLGRSGRHDAASYLAPRLKDQWVVAAESARALRELGAAGRRALESAATGEDGELARQMLWEAGARSRA
jgi:HEAT repeat protein